MARPSYHPQISRDLLPPIVERLAAAASFEEEITLSPTESMVLVLHIRNETYRRTRDWTDRVDRM